MAARRVARLAPEVRSCRRASMAMADACNAGAIGNRFVEEEVREARMSRVRGLVRLAGARLRVGGGRIGGALMWSTAFWWWLHLLPEYSSDELRDYRSSVAD